MALFLRWSYGLSVGCIAGVCPDAFGMTARDFTFSWVDGFVQEVYGRVSFVSFIGLESKEF